MDAGGNVQPELSAVRQLVERGHAVTVLTDDSAASEARSTGAEVRRKRLGEELGQMIFGK